QSAEDVARMVRALDHGRYWNPLTTAKIAGSFGVLNVGAAEVVVGPGEPGAVLSSSAEGVVVACGAGAVRLSRLTCQVKGLPVCPSTVRDLAPLGAEDAAALTRALAEVVPFEPRLRRALAAMQPLDLPGLVPGGEGGRVTLPVDTGLAGRAAVEAMALALRRALGPIARRWRRGQRPRAGPWT
ncbi:MAG: peptide synthetase, partial [Cypionkella sp.]|nr:peptide synthetase [Cypionkella sp.]